MFAIHRQYFKRSAVTNQYIIGDKEYVVVNISKYSTYAIPLGEKPTLYKLKCLAQRDADALNTVNAFCFIYTVTRYP